ncbi:MAG: hypothetical protein JWS08_00775 [Phormidium sp. PBR-2020]|nr:MAG: hypothetical protein JWS08_00775 [Phormidium sp. PBR-2020]
MMVALATVASRVHQALKTAQLVTRLEKNSRLALKQLEREDELQALLSATETAQELKFTTSSQQPYPTVKPIASLNQILEALGLQTTLQSKLEAHSNWVISIALNSDGTQIVSASNDGSVRLWDVATGELLHSFDGHQAPVHSTEFNNQGTQVVSAAWDGTLKLWDVATGELLHSLDGHSGSVFSAKFNDQGTQIVSAWHWSLKR